MKTIIIHFAIALIFTFLTVVFLNSGTEAKTFKDGVNVAIAFLCFINVVLYSVSGAVYTYSFIKSRGVNK